MKISLPPGQFTCCIALMMFLLCGSCNVGKKNVDSGYFIESFDNLYYWNSAAVVTRDKAHSGTYSTYVNKDHEFSETFQMDLDYAKNMGYKKLRVKAWCLKETDDTKADVIASVTSGPTQVSYNASELSIVLKRAGTWGFCTFSLDLPANAPPNSVIRVYLRSGNGHLAYMDDVEVIFKK